MSGVHLMVGPVAVVLGEEVVEAVHLVPVDQPVYDHVGALVGAVGGQGEHAVDLQPRQQPRARPGHVHAKTTFTQQSKVSMDYQHILTRARCRCLPAVSRPWSRSRTPPADRSAASAARAPAIKKANIFSGF